MPQAGKAANLRELVGAHLGQGFVCLGTVSSKAGQVM